MSSDKERKGADIVPIRQASDTVAAYVEQLETEIRRLEPERQRIEVFRKLVGKQVFVEYRSGSRYTGIVEGYAGGMLMLDSGMVNLAEVAFISDTLLPPYTPRGKH